MPLLSVLSALFITPPVYPQPHPSQHKGDVEASSGIRLLGLETGIARIQERGELRGHRDLLHREAHEGPGRGKHTLKIL